VASDFSEGQDEAGAATEGRVRRNTLCSAQRLHSPKDFERVYAARQAVHGPSLVVFACPNGLRSARLGVSVGKKHGDAVRRNRLKRVLRAAFRLSRHLLPPGNDYVLVPKRAAGGARLTVAVACEALVRAAKRLGKGSVHD
jgi:ribonuclease P protein component